MDSSLFGNLFHPWGWLILAGVLFVLEIAVPGVFFMWFGLAAALTGALAFSFDIGWQWQIVWFGVASLIAVTIAVRYLRLHPLSSERPLLNERAVRQIGQSFDLVDPIVNGRGSVRIGDSLWRVAGPDLPVGAKVTVTGCDGTLLRVIPADKTQAA